MLIATFVMLRVVLSVLAFIQSYIAWAVSLSFTVRLINLFVVFPLFVLILSQTFHHFSSNLCV